MYEAKEIMDALCVPKAKEKGNNINLNEAGLYMWIKYYVFIISIYISAYFNFMTLGGLQLKTS